MGSAMAVLGRGFDQAARAARKELGDVARKEHAAEAKRVAGGDRQFSNFGRKAKLNIRVRSTQAGVDIAPVGPWGIGEVGAKPHDIKPRGRKLKINGDVRAGMVRHPGHRGRQAWTKAEEATMTTLDRVVPQVLDAEVNRAAGS